MTKRAFLCWRAAVIFFANVPNLLMVLWLFFWVTRTTATATPGAWRWNAGAFALFVVLHSLSATPAWKRAFGKLFPEAFERAAYVVLSGVSLLALLAVWRPMPTLIWRVEGILGHVLDGVFWIALGCAWWVGQQFDQAAFVGTRQLAAHFRGEPPPTSPFVVKGPFRFSRHPMYLAMIVLMWSASTLTSGRLLFNVLATAYFVIGSRLEERRLVAEIGAPYLEYRRHVPALWPRLTPWTPEIAGAPGRS
ncbi:MAG: isoprenylcysteine carboxylmethyltransferase family protein [bacterium]